MKYCLLKAMSSGGPETPLARRQNVLSQVGSRRALHKEEPPHYGAAREIDAPSDRERWKLSPGHGEHRLPCLHELVQSYRGNRRDLLDHLRRLER